MIGVGFRHELAAWLEAGPAGADCVEITAEHFYDGGDARLAGIPEFPTLLAGREVP